MKNSILEITDQEYLIKLKKDDTNLSLIRKILRVLESEEYFFMKEPLMQTEEVQNNAINRELARRFDSLHDKYNSLKGLAIRSLLNRSIKLTHLLLHHFYLVSKQFIFISFLSLL